MRVKVFSLMGLLATSSWASPPKPPVLRVAFSEYAPYKIYRDKKQAGYDVMILTRLAELLGTKIEFIDCPFSRCLKLIEDGGADLITNLHRNAEREQIMKFIEPAYINKSRKVFYVRKDNPIQIRSLADLYGLKVGVKRGVLYFEGFDSDPKITKEPVTDVILNLKKLDRDRLDVIVNSEEQADYLIATNGYSNRFRKADLVYDETHLVFMALSLKTAWTKHLPTLAKALKVMLQSGEINKILDCSVGPTCPTAFSF